VGSSRRIDRSCALAGLVAARQSNVVVQKATVTGLTEIHLIVEGGRGRILP
jgi:hypothetical protein